MTNKLHIVCLDAPSPPDYGGAIDMYYKIKALTEAGVSITLHYFDYKENRGAGDLKSYCNDVFAYRRKPFPQAPTFSKPHIVASRINQALIQRLNANDDPILLEGIHCTGIIPYLNNKQRKIVVRLHNDEAIYYNHLAKAEANFFKRSYYAIESVLLKRYQTTLLDTIMYAAISETDAHVFKTKYGLKNTFVLPAFVPWQDVKSKLGRGTFCLYHGNLSVAENEAAALWLIETVFSQINLPLVIAGKAVSKKLQKAAALYRHITFKRNPTDIELERLIAEAHINVLPHFNNTGIKLKLLHAFFCGRFCITHNTEIKQSGTIAFAQTPQAYMEFLKSFMERKFTAADIVQRVETLRLYNNQQNAEALTARLY